MFAADTGSAAIRRANKGRANSAMTLAMPKQADPALRLALDLVGKPDTVQRSERVCNGNHRRETRVRQHRGEYEADFTDALFFDESP